MRFDLRRDLITPLSEARLIKGHGIDSPKKLILSPIFMMTQPNYYDPRHEVRSYLENDMTSQADVLSFSPDLARTQHAQLCEAILDLGASVFLSPGHSGQYDGVYRADSSMSMVRVTKTPLGLPVAQFNVVASNFYNYVRNVEVQTHLADWAALKNTLILEGIPTVVNVFQPRDCYGEGQAEHLYDPYRDLIFTGFKPKTEAFCPEKGRSDLKFNIAVGAYLGMSHRLIPLEVDGGFYHRDTSLAFLPNGEVLCHPPGFTSEAFQTLSHVVGQEKLISVGPDDALNFGCNIIPIDREHLLMPQTSTALYNTLSGLGYEVVQLELDQFVKLSGGGAHCLKNWVNRMRPDSMTPWL